MTSPVPPYSEQQFYESVIANANIWITALAPDGTILVWNNAAEQISGYRKKDIIGNRKVWSLLYPSREYRKKVTAEINRIITRDSYLENFETEIRCADGTARTIVWNTRALRDDRGTNNGYIAIGRDITAQKTAELRAAESSDRIRLLLNSAAEAIYGLDMNGNCTFCNNACLRILKYDDEKDLLGKNMHWLIHGKHADGSVFPAEECRIFRAFKDGRGTHVDDEVLWRADGTSFPAEYWSYPQRDKEQIIGAVVTFIDITERKQTEERIRELLRIRDDQIRIINASPAVSFLWKAEENWPVESVSENIALFGYTPDDFLSGKVLFSTLIHPDDLDRIEKEVGQYSTNGIDNYYQEYRIFGKKGELYWISDYTHIRRNSAGVITHYEGIVLDISKRKQAQEALRVANEYLTSLFDYANAPIIVWDPEYRITRFNHAFERLTGLTEQEVLGSQLAILFPEASCESSLDLIKKTLTGERWESVEIPILHISGTVRTVLWNSATLYAPDGKTVVATIAQGQDITERKRAESAFHESRQLFMNIISFLPDPTFVIDKDGIVIAWNRALEQLSGVSGETIIGKGNHEYSLWMYGKRRPMLIDLVLTPDKDAARLDYTDIRQEGRTITAQLVIRRPGSDTKIPLSLVASPLLDPKGTVTGAIESMRDISRIKEAEAELARFNANLETIIRERTQALNEEIAQRKHAEEEVHAALGYTRSVIEANPDLMAVLDETGTILDVNTAAERLTGIPREQLIGNSYARYLIDNSTPTDILVQLREKGRIEYTVQLARADGQITPLSVNSTLFSKKESGEIRIIVAAHDITRQKQDEAAIKAALDEQVLLLREVHHRVKNNLQIIISLTNLQMRQSDDPRVRQIMSETQNRVRAMSLVHEKLYRSQNLSQIDFAEYTRFLATQLFSYYGMDTRRVRLEFGMGKIMVDIVTAVPLGLLLNELVSNAIKHAFPQGREGTITIRGGCEGDVITLTVADNGVGIPKDLDWKNTSSLGMRLVTSLVDQVDGTITLDQENGTVFTITMHSMYGSGSGASMPLSGKG